MSEKIFDGAVSTPIVDQQAIETLVGHLKFARQYTLSLLEDLSDEDWFKQPVEGTTHIAWQVGHIAMSQYGLCLFRQRGRAEVDLELMPSSFRKKYSRGTTPDPSPEKNPSPSAIKDTLARVFDQAVKEIPEFTLDQLNTPVDPPFAAYSTNYGALLFAVDHEMLHAGQIGLIRRLIGKQPLR